MNLDQNDSKNSKEGEANETWTFEKLKNLDLNGSSKRNDKDNQQNLPHEQSQGHASDTFFQEESENGTYGQDENNFEPDNEQFQNNERHTPKNGNVRPNYDMSLTPGWIKSSLQNNTVDYEGKIQLVGNKVIEGETFFKFSDSSHSMYNFRSNGDDLNAIIKSLDKYSIITVKKCYRQGFCIVLEEIEVSNDKPDYLIQDPSVDKVEYLDRKFLERLVSPTAKRNDGSYDERHPFFSERTPILRKTRSRTDLPLLVPLSLVKRRRLDL